MLINFSKKSIYQVFFIMVILFSTLIIGCGGGGGSISGGEVPATPTPTVTTKSATGHIQNLLSIPHTSVTDGKITINNQIYPINGDGFFNIPYTSEGDVQAEISAANYTTRTTLLHMGPLEQNITLYPSSPAFDTKFLWAVVFWYRNDDPNQVVTDKTIRITSNFTYRFYTLDSDGVQVPQEFIDTFETCISELNAIISNKNNVDYPVTLNIEYKNMKPQDDPQWIDCSSDIFGGTINNANTIAYCKSGASWPIIYSGQAFTHANYSNAITGGGVVIEQNSRYVVIHELLHSLGLHHGHPYYTLTGGTPPKSVMNYSPYDDTDMNDLDRNILKIIYSRPPKSYYTDNTNYNDEININSFTATSGGSETYLVKEVDPIIK